MERVRHGSLEWRIKEVQEHPAFGLLLGLERRIPTGDGRYVVEGVCGVRIEHIERLDQE